ncbi:hypothetical protein P3X46_024900 [Hevea brasiliensis]|uniref:NAC domain-containing protein n=1 Tax=Hevea brasiliensis TaxID=3981 RepID=A0ABQ9L7B8_HEVBR|nr:protein SOB FIVE-LIKE 5-like [Hevea brasiliensis]KAJ9159392.1 hypothetical protein P3X46_024900 [Hevea brasiliensis]
MNAFASECNSGCESGWTLYLEQSFLSPTTAAAAAHRGSKQVDGRKSGSGFCDKEKIANKEESDHEEQEHDEEDLSMVSDASSGPPHHFIEDESNYFNYDNNGYFFPAFKDTTLINNGGKGKKEEELPSFLDDTASSPAFNLSKNNNFSFMPNNQASVESTLDYSQASTSSATHFELRSAYQDHYDSYIQSSPSGNQLQNNQWF